MPSYGSKSLVGAFLLSLTAQMAAGHDVGSNTCPCVEQPEATVTETHTVTAGASTVTVTHTPTSSEGASGSVAPTQIVYVTSGSTIRPITVTVTAAPVIVTETRTYFVTDGSTIPPATVVVTATATASPQVVTATVMQSSPPHTVFVRGSDTIVPQVVTVTETATNNPEPVTITVAPGAETTGSESSQPTTTVDEPADHHCHKNGTCHNHPGTSYSVTQIELPTFCGVSTVMETVYNTITQTVFPSDPSGRPTPSLGTNSTLPFGGTGSSAVPVHTVVPPRLRDARFIEARNPYY